MGRGPKPKVEPVTDWTRRLDDPRFLIIDEIAQIFRRPIGTIARQMGDGSLEVMPKIRGRGKTALWATHAVKQFITSEPAKQGGPRK